MDNYWKSHQFTIEYITLNQVFVITFPVSVTHMICPMELCEHSTKQTMISIGLKSYFWLYSKEYTLTSSSFWKYTLEYITISIYIYSSPIMQLVVSWSFEIRTV